MNIYLVQHGKPMKKEENPERPLSQKGRVDVERIGTFLKEANVQVREIYCSKKRRARETATILASLLHPGLQPEERAGLSPMDEVDAIADEISKMRENIMIVGHLPHLAKLVSLLVAGEILPSMVEFQQGGVVCLQAGMEANQWNIAWMVVPDILPS